jgi:hypothetical protein
MASMLCLFRLEFAEPSVMARPRSRAGRCTWAMGDGTGDKRQKLKPQNLRAQPAAGPIGPEGSPAALQIGRAALKIPTIPVRYSKKQGKRTAMVRISSPP